MKLLKKMDILSDVNISGNLTTTGKICAENVTAGNTRTKYVAVFGDNCNYDEHLALTNQSLNFYFRGDSGVYFCQSLTNEFDINISRTVYGSGKEFDNFDLFSTISEILFVNSTVRNCSATVDVPSGCKEFLLTVNKIGHLPLIVAYDANHKRVEMDYQLCIDSCLGGWDGKILVSVATDAGGTFCFRIV